MTSNHGRKTVTSFRIDARIAEILDIMNISFVKVFYRGLAAYGLEGKIRDPRVIQLLKRYYEEFSEDMKAEDERWKKILTDIENPEPRRISMTPDDDERPLIQEERPTHIRPTTQEWLRTDVKYATFFLRNTLVQYLENNLHGYDGDNTRALGDLKMVRDDPVTDAVDREGLDIILLRPDLDVILTSSIKDALKVITV